MILNKQTLSEQIYQILRQDILLQNLPCGSKLTLKTLQERFEVSSTPIREALTRLAEEGLVSYYSNVGVRVLDFSAEDLQEIYSFMGDLDALALRYAADHADREELKEKLSANIRECDEKREDFLELSDQFHLLFYRYCGNSRLTRAAERLRSQLSVAAYQYEKNPQNQRLILAEHREIMEAFCTDETEKAAQLMKIHLMHSMEHALEIFR